LEVKATSWADLGWMITYHVRINRLHRLVNLLQLQEALHVIPGRAETHSQQGQINGLVKMFLLSRPILVIDPTVTARFSATEKPLSGFTTRSYLSRRDHAMPPTGLGRRT
jgi:hypothetical protein